jgi:hypothetical protein
MPQHARPPDLAGPRRFQDAVARSVAFYPDRVESGAGVCDREVETECAAIVGMGRLPSLSTEKFVHRVAKSVTFGTTRFAFGRPFGHQTSE